MKNTKNAKIKVLVCMSGGVDSSVSAALLVRDGYDVTGVFMRQWSDSADLHGVCEWKKDRRDAIRVAAHLGIPLLTLDFEREYREQVTEYMFREYEAGRTPNPDVLCNTYIKFGVWLDWALKHGFDYLATGHYSRLGRKIQISKIKIPNNLKKTNQKIKLLQAKDKDKDQTYFLHQLNQEQLSHVMFPIGGMLKSEVRSLARKLHLPTAEREESMGICFVGEMPMKDFLSQRIKPKKGKIIMSDGTVVGEHDGLAFYTIGQRHLKISKIKNQKSNQIQNTNEQTKPLFIVGKDVKKNTLVVGYEDDKMLYKREITLGDIHWVSGESPDRPLQCEIRLRHRQPLRKAIVNCPASAGSRYGSDQLSGVSVSFKEPERAPTPGQFAVFYKGGACLGGGVII